MIDEIGTKVRITNYQTRDRGYAGTTKQLEQKPHEYLKINNKKVTRIIIEDEGKVIEPHDDYFKRNEFDMIWFVSHTITKVI